MLNSIKKYYNKLTRKKNMVSIKLSEFSRRELVLASHLLSYYGQDYNLPAEFLGNDVELCFNKDNGKIFLTTKNSKNICKFDKIY